MPYLSCCQPLILGLLQAESPEQLMRSRYSAYCDKSAAALAYIAQTYHPSQHHPDAAAEIAAFAAQAQFLKLHIIARTPPSPLTEVQIQAEQLPAQSEALGTVHFLVHYLYKGQLHLLEENSRFVFQNTWRYLDGIFTPHPAQKIGRNDSCPCQSGKKFKQCHG